MEEFNKERNESIHSGTRPTTAAATIWPVQSNSPSSSSHTSVWLTLRCISSKTGNSSCIAFFLLPHSENETLKLELSSFVWVLLLLGNSFLSLFLLLQLFSLLLELLPLNHIFLCPSNERRWWITPSPPSSCASLFVVLQKVIIFLHHHHQV